jgi:hypothetical protein
MALMSDRTKDEAPAPKARVRDALMTLEYPRQLHKAGGLFLRVENETEARAAVADGWCVDANEANKPAGK